MKREDFEKLVSDPIGCMVFQMDNWEIDPQISVDTFHQTLVNTMKGYLKALAIGDDVLMAKCIAKLDEIRQIRKLE